MNTTSKDPIGKAEDAISEIARLRDQVEALVRERSASVAERVEAAVHDAAGEVHERTEALAGHVRERPLTALLIAAGVGYLFGRIGH